MSFIFDERRNKMKHTECKDCALSNGDCGHHFKMDGITNYEIASLSACDKYGNCDFFKPKTQLRADLIYHGNPMEWKETKESSSWIPVSERLPEKKGYYLTSTVFNEVYCDFWNGVRFARTEEILAWMPLPEHYKKEE